MSDYCRGCRYDVKKRTGAGACPFNFLYWDFIARHAVRLGANTRMQPVLRGWNRFAEKEQRQIRSEASRFLAAMDEDGAQ
jgi:deoxyribodipyrimidine photolyase-related protein